MKKIFLPLVILLKTAILFAVPTWSVDAASFEFSMTITGIVALEGDINGGENDLIGAFVGDECRGVAVAVFDADYNQYQFFLTVFSNSYQSEEVTIKYYRQTEDKEYTEFEKIAFKEGQIFGSSSAPYDFMTGLAQVDINEKVLEQLNVFPNPTNDILFINTSEKSGLLRIMDVSGKLVYESNFYENQINVSSLANGCYLLGLETKGLTHIGRFIKN